MFYELSKTVGIFLTNPGNLFFVVLVVGAVLLWTPARRLGRALVAAVIGFALIVMTVPMGRHGILLLENRFPAAPLPARVDGVVVLAGMVDQFVTRARGQLTLSGAVERLIVFADVARRYPDAKLVFSGGSGVLGRQDATEAGAVRDHAALLGLDPARVVFEDRSRNTHENAVFSHALAQPKPGETWVLITSAFHMPRAVGAFRRAGWTVVPYPVDYALEPDPPMSWQMDFLGAMGTLRSAVHEWTGLAAYRLTGKTDALFPAPER
ncbi:MAG: YdcF family protein [Pseudomonadota bacterium]